MAWKLSSTTFVAWYGAAITCLDRGEIENWAIDGYWWLLMAIDGYWWLLNAWRIGMVPKGSEFLVPRICWFYYVLLVSAVEIPSLGGLVIFGDAHFGLVNLHWSRSFETHPGGAGKAELDGKSFFKLCEAPSKWDGQVNIGDCTGALTQALKSLAGVYLGFRARNYWMFEFVRLLWFHVLCCWVCFGFSRFTWQLNACILFYSLAK